MLWVVGLLLRRGLGVPGVRLASGRRSGVAALSRSGLVGHVGHVVLPVGIGIVVHRHLVIPARREDKLFSTAGLVSFFFM